jgi:TonB family protein
MYSGSTTTYALKKEETFHKITKKNYLDILPELLRDDLNIYKRLQEEPPVYEDIMDIVYKYAHGVSTTANNGASQLKPGNEPPMFDGGFDAMMEFIRKNMKYPVSARRMGISGTVYTNFIVEEDGTLSNVLVERGISADCDHEAVRVILLMPKWVPAKENGKPVRSEYTLPIKFKLN